MGKQVGENISSKRPQIIAALSACIGAFALGTVCAWTSPVLPYVNDCIPPDQENQNGDEGKNICSFPVPLDDTQKSLVGSLFPIGALISGQVSGIMMRVWGRKLTMISMSLPCLIGWICLLIPKYIESDNSNTYAALFYVGRLFTGFGSGAFTLAVPAYVTEIAESSIQGALSSCMQLSITIGILFINGLAIENAVEWPIITGISIAFPLLMSLAMLKMPETPYYLITRGKREEAAKSLSWLRGPNYDITEELQETENNFKDQQNVGSVSIKQLVTKSVYLKPFAMAMGLMFFQQFSGINAVLFYLQEIFIASKTELSTKGLSAFLVCLVQVIATGAAVMLVDRFGRRILLILSAVFMCVSLVGLGVYFYILENPCIEGASNLTTTTTTTTTSATVLILSKAEEVPVIPFCIEGDGLFPEQKQVDFGWLPLTSLIIYIFFFSIGFGPLAWSVNAEIFPREAKGLGSSIATSFNWLCAFFVTQFQSDMGDGMHKYGVYFLYAANCALAIAFVFIILPETKGKSPEDMKAYFLGHAVDKNQHQRPRGNDNAAFQNS